MTRDEIYDHLAQVYLGKRKEAEPRKKKHFHAWLAINVPHYVDDLFQRLLRPDRVF